GPDPYSSARLTRELYGRDLRRSSPGRPHPDMRHRPALPSAHCAARDLKPSPAPNLRTALSRLRTLIASSFRISSSVRTLCRSGSAPRGAAHLVFRTTALCPSHESRPFQTTGFRAYPSPIACSDFSSSPTSGGQPDEHDLFPDHTSGSISERCFCPFAVAAALLALPPNLSGARLSRGLVLNGATYGTGGFRLGS